MQVNKTQNSYLEDIYKRMSSGKRVNSAADDAAGLAILEKLEAQVNGLERGTQNTREMGDLLRTAEGGLASISDSLQRVRELSLQAMNATLGDDDRQKIQYEIDQQLQHVAKAADSTEYNTMRLLDGSFADMNTASSPSGKGMQITIENTTLEGLGLKDYSVLDGKPDLSVIDEAMTRVNASRAKIGASQNTLDHTVLANQISHENMVISASRIADMDMAKGSMELSAARVKEQYQTFMLKKQIDSQKTTVKMLM